MASTKHETTTTTTTPDAPTTADKAPVTAPDSTTGTDGTTPTPTAVEAFVALVVGAVTGATPADDGTRTANQADLNEAFRALDKADRTACRNGVEAAYKALMMSATTQADLVTVRGIMTAHDGLSAATPKASATPADPRPGMIQALFTLRQAVADLEAEVGTVTDDESGAVTVTPEAVALVTKASLPKVGRTAHDGPKGDVAAHLAEVFSEAEVGTFLTFTQIAHKVTDAYPAGNVSSGAVAARAKSPSWQKANPGLVVGGTPAGITKQA
jgi:hypothetical protein